MKRAEADAGPDAWPEQVHWRNRAAGDELRQLHAPEIEQRGANGHVDAAHAIAVGDRELDDVLAGIDARASRKHQRRGHARGRRDPHVRHLAVHRLAVLVEDVVRDRQTLRRRVVRPDLRVNQQPHFRRLEAAERERDGLDRQARRRERRRERSRRRFARCTRTGGRRLGAGQHRPVRANGRARARDVDADGMRLAVAIARVGFDAEQVVPGQLRADALEYRRRRCRSG